MTSRPERLAKRITPTLLLLLALGGALLVATPRRARADGGCKPDGQRCQTNISCCSRNCMKPAAAPGKGKPLFGTCCTASTCAGKCGTIPNGDCGGTLNCGNTCTGFNTCGGGGTPNVCGCTSTTCAACVADCGTIADGCGGMLDCGTCTPPDTCGGGGVAHQCGCTPTTCGATDCGTIDNGCGGTLDCGPCPTTTTTTTSTTTTTLPLCGTSGALIACTCGDGQTPCSSPATSDCTGPTPCCEDKQAECVRFCGALGPGTCGTAPCTDCITNQPCQGGTSGGPVTCTSG